jgi:alpha-tubulin suppressor-like RCC1 family protein
MLHRTVIACAALLALCAACDDESELPLVGPGYRCDVTIPVEDVITPDSGTLLFRTPVRATDTLRIPVTVLGRTGQPRTDVPMTFTSSDSSIVVVDSAGIAHARGAAGTATVTVEVCGEKSTVSIRALPAVQRIAVTPSQAALIVGDTLRVTAHAISQTGAVMNDVAITWTSSGSAATVTERADTLATVRAVAPGTVTITAAGEGLSGTVAVAVSNLNFNVGAAAANSGLAAGLDFGCGIASANGRAYCWGAGYWGQLGAIRTDSTCFRTPDQSNNTPFILAGESGRCTLAPKPADAAAPTFTSISAGGVHACGLTSAGRAWCWGGMHDNPLGEIGNGTSEGVPVPTLVTSALTFSQISVGGQHTCAMAGSTPYCWGADTLGQLGDWRTIHSTTPIPVTLDPGTGVTLTASQVTAGFFHSCAIALDGAAWCWGSSRFGQTGTGPNDSCPTVAPGPRVPLTASVGCVSPPAMVGTAVRFTQVSAGGFHTCGVGTDKFIYCWGLNESGQLGVTLADGAQFTGIPQRIGSSVTFKQVSVGYRYSCGLGEDNAIYCWGNNEDLQLGRGVFSAATVNPTPSRIAQGQAGTASWTRVSAGYRSACAVASDSRTYCWGSNVWGALGNTLQAAFRGQPQLVSNPQ